MNIDFQHFKMFTNITKTDKIEMDVRRDFADLIYKNATGVQALELAMRIYKTDGALEISAEDLEFLTIFVQSTTPIFQDSFSENFKE